jgi:hypothetical protein
VVNRAVSCWRSIWRGKVIRRSREACEKKAPEQAEHNPTQIHTVIPQ